MPERCAWLALVALLSGCLGQPSGVTEAFRVRDAQFLEGELPGTAPDEDEEASDEDGPPKVTAIETFNLDVFQGQGGKAFRGRVSANASAVAIALEGVDSGYWVIPTGSPDPVTEELTWSAVTDFDISLRTGKHALRVVAIDESGRAGIQLDLTLCVTGRVPDNRSACSPDKQPPRAVISLQWDVNADLDLKVVDPDGHVIDAKHPYSAGLTADGKTPMEGGVFDRDSNAGCAVDGVRTENLVWNNDAPEGTYRIYVNLFDACKQPAVRFRVAVHRADEDDSAARFAKPRLLRSGELLDLAADTSGERGLFVAEYSF